MTHSSSEGPKPSVDDTLPDLQTLVGRNWVTWEQCATIIGVSYRTIRNWCLPGKDGSPPKLETVKVGGHYRIYEDELRRFLTEGNRGRIDK